MADDRGRVRVTSRAIVLPVQPIGQPEAQCGNTSLHMVCRYHRVPATIRELARLAKTTENGTDHKNLVDAAAQKGATVFYKHGGTLDELRWFVNRGLPPIIGWWAMTPEDLHFDTSWTLPQRRAHDCGHFSVVSGMTRTAVVIVDPQWRTTRSGRPEVVGAVHRRKREFLATWYDTDTPRYAPVKRWYMVVNFTGERFADRIGGGRDRAAMT